MKDDDDEVGFDLTAWEAPPPPSGIADAVIDRMRAPDAKPAVEAAPVRRLRWWMIAAAPIAAASVVGVVAFSLATRDDGVVSNSGAVATAKPSHLELGGTVVDLEGATDVWWVREGKRVVAMQPRGKATWKVAAGDELVIDAGATVASVKASGASLRVEVEMNLSDARLIGTSAATAAAVALVTVIVYEGHVKVTGSDKTVEATAGTTIQIAPNKPPVEPDRVSGLEKRLEAKIKFLELENELLRHQVAGTVPKPPAIDSKFDAVLASAVDHCRMGGFKGKLGITIDLDQHGAPSAVRFDPEDAKPASCLGPILMREVRFPDSPNTVFRTSISTEEPVVASRTPTPRPRPIPSDSPPVKPPPDVAPAPAGNRCSDKAVVDEMELKADNAASGGMFAAALSYYEAILQCRPRLVTKAYLAACRSRSFQKAKVHFKAIGRENLAQVCMKEGFDPR